MAVGRVLGLDYGTVRIGVAVSDALGITARPVRSVDADRFGEELEALLDELEPSLVVIGLPVSLAGVEGASAAGARALAATVEVGSGLHVEFADERFTTTRAEELLARSLRDRRDRRDLVDATAAAVMLQSWLDTRAGSARANLRHLADDD